jgi:WD40 repeat protein
MTGSTEERRVTLRGFDEALRREAHNLASDPGLLWQQLYNRLQWRPGLTRKILTAEAARRSTLGAAPWMRTRIPFREADALLRTLSGRSVSCCAVSPEGSYLVSGGAALKLWDPASGQELRTLTGHAQPVLDCAVSPDGAYVVSASIDRTLKLWDPATGRELHTFAGHTSQVTDCAVSPDGSYILSASLHDGTLRQWDSATGRELRTLVAATSRDSTTRVWDSTGQRLLREAPVRLIDPVDGCAISPDGAFIVYTRWDGTIRVLDPATGQQQLTLAGHSNAVLDCAVSPDAAFIVSASRDGTLKLWDPASGRELRTLAGHTDEVECCAVSPDGAYIVSGGLDNTIKLWDPATGRELQTLAGHNSQVTDCAVSPDGSYLISAGGALNLWDPANGPELGPFPAGHTGSVWDCAVSPDGSYAVSASVDATLKLWDTASGRELRTLTGHTGAVLGCAVSPDGSYIVSGGGALALWDPVSGEQLRTLSIQADHDGITSCAVSPNGARIFSAHGPHGTVTIWAQDSGRALRTFKGRGVEVADHALSPDGSYIVFATRDGALQLWDPAGLRKPRTIDTQTRVTGCAVSPDGSYIVCASRGPGTLTLWDTASGRELRTLAVLPEEVERCAVTPDGGYIVSASLTGATLKLWDLTSNTERARIPLVGGLSSIDLHPWLPMVVCGDLAGNVYLVDLVSIEYGPIIVTPVHRGHRLVIRCPACGQEHSVDDKPSARDLVCPAPQCGLHLRVNQSIRKKRPRPPSPWQMIKQWRRS